MDVLLSCTVCTSMQSCVCSCFWLMVYAMLLLAASLSLLIAGIYSASSELGYAPLSTCCCSLTASHWRMIILAFSNVSSASICRCHWSFPTSSHHSHSCQPGCREPWCSSLHFSFVLISHFKPGQVENAEMETAVRKQKYGNRNTEVRQKATYGSRMCLVGKVWLSLSEVRAKYWYIGLQWALKQSFSMTRLHVVLSWTCSETTVSIC